MRMLVVMPLSLHPAVAADERRREMCDVLNAALPRDIRVWGASALPPILQRKGGLGGLSARAHCERVCLCLSLWCQQTIEWK